MIIKLFKKFFLFFQVCYGSNASPKTFTVTQPNGIKIDINIRGNHQIPWNSDGLSSRIYFIEFNVEDIRELNKITFVK